MTETSHTIPFVFLPYQQKWAGDTAQVKVIEKSRRIGLSWSEAGDDTLFAASASGSDVWYIGYNKDMAEEFINDCAWWARKYEDVVGTIGAIEEQVIQDDGKDILTFRIRFASGHKIVALSSRPSNLRGKQGRVIIDEAAYHEDLNALIKSAIAMLIWGGDVRIISTHDGDAGQFNELVRDIRAGRKPYSLHRVTLDDALDQGFYRRICLKLGTVWSRQAQDQWRQNLIDSYGSGADEELFCIPSHGSGAFLTRSLIEGCMSTALQVFRFSVEDEFTFLPEDTRMSELLAWCEENLQPILESLDPKRRSYFGEDFGRSGDLTVLIPLVETQGATFEAPFVVELRNVPFRQQEQVVCYLLDRLPRFSHGSFDARGNGQFLAEVVAQRYGQSRISQVMPSEKWYRDNMGRYKAAFEDKTIMLPQDADIIDDHRAFRMINGVGRLPDSKTSGGRNNQRHGDSGIAGAMAWHATGQEGGGETEYESVGKRRMTGGCAW